MKNIITTAVAIGMMSTSAHALSTNSTAQVTSVEPQYQNVRVSTPQRTCEVVQVPIYNNNGQSGTSGILGGTADALNGQGDQLAGALFGGLLGNQIGKGGNRDVATALGVIIGSNIGRNNANNNSNNVAGYRNVEQCNTTYTETVERQLNGYRVGFDYNGMQGVMKTNRSYNVGDRIKVRVTVKPIN